MTVICGARYNKIRTQSPKIDLSEGRCGVVVSRNVVVTQIRSDPGSIPGISTHFLLSSSPKTLLIKVNLFRAA